MADLIAKPPLFGLAPMTIGALTLSPLDLGPITSISPLKGQERKLATALKPLGFPAPNQMKSSAGRRIIWTGRDQAFLIGSAPQGLEGLAATTDQSDGWAGLYLTGQGAAACLMRLIPVDLDAMPANSCIRAPLGHMASVLIKTDAGFDLLVFRSMVQTAWHELETVMKSLSARQANGC